MPNGEGCVKGGVVIGDQGEDRAVAVSAKGPVVVVDHGRAQAVQENQEVWEDLSRAEARRRREVMEGTAETVKNPSRRDQ